MHRCLLTAIPSQVLCLLLGRLHQRYKRIQIVADERHQKKNKAIKLTDSVKNYISEKLKE
jgi:hypothetical protein